VLTNSTEEIIIEKMTAAQIINIFLAFRGTKRIIIVLRADRGSDDFSINMRYGSPTMEWFKVQVALDFCVFGLLVCVNTRFLF
jgi:hypothetical protein